MNLTIIAVGRAKSGPERVLFQEYQRRLPWRLDLVEVEERRKLDSQALRRRESELLLAKVPDGAFMAALDERGTSLDSLAFSRKLKSWAAAGGGRVALLIGGADGHGDAVRDQANALLSLGEMTWPHMLVRAMLAEQLYRAWSIANRHPYHRV
ncbi:MAG: 23S rRNA (pseudouridine(1915)-N(3))-methyltransferase RlmH [Alphaproteobacteria bacterium]